MSTMRETDYQLGIKCIISVAKCPWNNRGDFLTKNQLENQAWVIIY